MYSEPAVVYVSVMVTEFQTLVNSLQLLVLDL